MVWAAQEEWLLARATPLPPGWLMVYANVSSCLARKSSTAGRRSVWTEFTENIEIGICLPTFGTFRPRPNHTYVMNMQ